MSQDSYLVTIQHSNNPHRTGSITIIDQSTGKTLLNEEPVSMPYANHGVKKLVCSGLSSRKLLTLPMELPLSQIISNGKENPAIQEYLRISKEIKDQGRDNVIQSSDPKNLTLGFTIDYAADNKTMTADEHYISLREKAFHVLKAITERSNNVVVSIQNKSPFLFIGKEPVIYEHHNLPTSVFHLGNRLNVLRKSINGINQSLSSFAPHDYRAPYQDPTIYERNIINRKWLPEEYSKVRKYMHNVLTLSPFGKNKGVPTYLSRFNEKNTNTSTAISNAEQSGSSFEKFITENNEKTSKALEHLSTGINDDQNTLAMAQAINAVPSLGEYLSNSGSPAIRAAINHNQQQEQIERERVERNRIRDEESLKNSVAYNGFDTNTNYNITQKPNDTTSKKNKIIINSDFLYKEMEGKQNSPKIKP